MESQEEPLGFCRKLSSDLHSDRVCSNGRLRFLWKTGARAHIAGVQLLEEAGAGKQVAGGADAGHRAGHVGRPVPGRHLNGAVTRRRQQTGGAAWCSCTSVASDSPFVCA